MTLFNGIANNLRCFEYAKQNIYFPDGRGYIDFTELLSKMKIPYETLSVDQLSHCKDVSDILIFAPKEIFDNMDIIKHNITGIYIVYSAFFIKRITSHSVTLCMVYFLAVCYLFCGDALLLEYIWHANIMQWFWTFLVCILIFFFCFDCIINCEIYL